MSSTKEELGELKKELDSLKKQLASISEAERIAALEQRQNLLLQLQQSSSSSGNAAAAASTTTTLTAEEAEKLLQEAGPLFSSGKYSEAVSLYTQVVDAISLNESDPSLKKILSRALSNRSGSFLLWKKPKEALDDARRCVDVRPSWVRGHLRVAEAAEELKEIDVVVSAYLAAMKAEDRSGNVHSKQEIESDILRVQRRQFESLMNKIFETAVSAASIHDNIRDAVLTTVKYCTCPESAADFCASIGSFAIENAANKVLFGTASVRDALNTVSKYCTTTKSADFFCRSIANLVANDDNKILFGTASVRDALLTVSEYCADVDSARYFCRAIGSLTLNNNDRILFGTAFVRDALLIVSKYCTTTPSARSFCGAIENIISHNESNRVLFANENIRDAILSVSFYLHVYYGVYCCCHAISLFHETSPTLFCVEETVTSLVNLSKIEMKKQSVESIYWFLSTVLSLLQSDKKLFNTTEIRNSVEIFEEVVNDPDKVEKLEKVTVAVDKLSNEEYLDKARQLCALIFDKL